MGEMDISFRRVIRDLPEGFLSLAFPGRTFEVIGPLDASADRPRLRLSDCMLRVRDGGQDVIVHVELERDWRSILGRRVYEYATAAHVATWLEIASVVVLLRAGGAPPENLAGTSSAPSDSSIRSSFV